MNIIAVVGGDGILGILVNHLIGVVIAKRVSKYILAGNGINLVFSRVAGIRHVHPFDPAL